MFWAVCPKYFHPGLRNHAPTIYCFTVFSYSNIYKRVLVKKDYEIFKYFIECREFTCDIDRHLHANNNENRLSPQS